MKLSTLESTSSSSVGGIGFTRTNSLSSVERERLPSLTRLDLDNMEGLKSMNLEPKSAPYTSSSTFQQAAQSEIESYKVQEVGRLVPVLEEDKHLEGMTLQLANMVTGVTPKQKVLASSSFQPLDLSSLQNMDEKLREDSCTPLRQVNYYTKNCTKIRPYLFTGGEIASKDRGFLLRNKIRYIVELSHTKRNTLYHDNSFEYYHFLLRDQEGQELMAVSYQVEAIVEEAVANNRAVLVHCQRGISRSAAVVAACLMMREGRSFDSVYDEVCRLRPISAPNAGFIDDLAQLEERLQKGCRELRVYKFSVEEDTVHAEFVPYRNLFSNTLVDSSLPFAEDAVYLLQFPLSDGVYVWIGQIAPLKLLGTAITFAKRLVRYEICLPLHTHLLEHEEGQVEIFQEHQGKESDSFLQQWKKVCSPNLILEG